MSVPSGGTFEKSHTSLNLGFLIYIMEIIVAQLFHNVVLRFK